MARLGVKAFQGELQALAGALRRQIETDCQAFPLDSAAIVERRARARAADGFRFFCQTYFPHYLSAPPALLHEFLFEALPALVADPRGRHLALAAPRGEAKSTLAALLFPLWAVLTGRKRYVVLVMDALDQALPALEAIKAELDSNPRLKMDFPDETGEGRIWQARVILTAKDAKIEVFGSGKRMRGLRHGPHRPDLVLLDDIENDDNVRNPTQRDKLENWLKKTVLPLGAADGSLDVFYIGTVLHYDSVLARTLKNPLWETHTFRAVLDWPDRMDLWERWEETLRNQGEEAADAYYARLRALMDRGARVSWPAQRPLLALMKTRARDGHATFDAELQNDPINATEALFQRLTFWVEPDSAWIFFGACDPSLGKHGAGRDPSALLVGGLNRATGVLSVVEANIRRRLPDAIIEEIIALQARYHCVAWAIEAVQFQEFFRTELVKRSAARGCPVPAWPVVPHADKTLRIETLQPHVANGLIQFHAGHLTLLEQLRHYPAADHDDGPDALHMLWELAAGHVAGQRRFSFKLKNL
jgi:predicted phage terminase large subunit-like protein